MDIYFSDHFKVSRAVIAKYGAFNVSLVADLPLFIDPFLLFNSPKKRYQELHRDIIAYLRFLRDKSKSTNLNEHLIAAWFRFPEVTQTWLGFSQSGNSGRGLGNHFASALHTNLNHIFHSFGSETITKGSHLEKLCLIKDGVGRDNISDFTTNLIKGFLLEFTQSFARQHIDASMRRQIAIPKVRFNYTTESWESATYDLPWHGDDYVILVPKDLLTKDDTWINKSDLVREFESIPTAIPDGHLRAQIDNYFRNALPDEPTREDWSKAVGSVIREYPQVIDYFIRLKEDNGDDAVSVSSIKVKHSELLYVHQFGTLPQFLANNTDFYKTHGNTLEEARQRVVFLKDVIENKGGHRVFYDGDEPIRREADIQVFYRLTWFASPSEISREVNDGRGPVDFKISRGSADKTLVEFKLASNSQLKRNLQRQVAIYEKASNAGHSIKAIFFFTQEELEKVNRVFKELDLTEGPDLVLIDARADNKPSGSKA